MTAYNLALYERNLKIFMDQKLFCGILFISFFEMTTSLTSQLHAAISAQRYSVRCRSKP